MNPTINKAVIFYRIAMKVHRASERMGRLPATGTQAVLRCNGKVVFTTNVQLSPREDKKEYVN